MSETLWVRIDLETPALLSAHAGTVGAHETLTRVRGAVLLGIVASRGYTHPRAFELFHSGAVRYGDALPLVGTTPAWPMPLSLHAEKRGGPASPLWNLAATDRPIGVQIDQQRGGYVTAQGIVVEPTRSYVMRTAIGPDGRAQEGMLFGMEALEAGQSFLAPIEADDPALLELVAERLLTDGTAHIGRSRTAEFGRVRLSRAAPPPPVERSSPSTSLCVWCLADVALRDRATGSPRLVPVGADLGVPGARLDPARTFIRSFRWSPYNRHRGGFDPERQVLAAGSVLTFVADRPIDADVVQAHVARGVGEHLAEGLGRVAVAPPLLGRAHPILTRATPPPPPEAAAPEGELLGWLVTQNEDQAATLRARAQAREWEPTVRSARIPNAQWGELRWIAARHRGPAGRAPLLTALRAHLGLGPNDQPVQGGGVTNLRWGPVARRLLGLLNQADVADPGLTLEILARRMARPAGEDA